jgi:hypothetical protein
MFYYERIDTFLNMITETKYVRCFQATERPLVAATRNDRLLCL